MKSFGHTFQVFQIEDSDDKYVYLDDFCDYLKHKEKDIKLFNVRRTIKGYKGGIKEYQKKNIVPVRSALRYIFQSADTCVGCNVLANVVETQVVGQQKSVNIFRLVQTNCKV